MTSWKTYKIGDLCKISSSKRIFAKEYKDSGIPFYRGKEIIEKQKGNKISTELYISQERYDEIKAKHGVPQKGDMLLTSVGTLGIPYIVQDEVFYFKDGNLTWFYNFEGLDSRYLYYWFLSPIGKMNIDSKAIGSTQKALTIETLSKFEISLPGLEEQRRIAGILGAIDDKIENNRRINTNLELQAQALYKQWFVDNRSDDWETKPLSEIITIYDSQRKPLSGQQREKMDKVYPYYGAASLMDYVDGYLFDGIYLLLGEDGTVVDELGFPILQYVWGKFWVNNHAHILTGKNGFSTETLYVLLKQTSVKSIVTGAVQPKISQANLKNISVTIPPIHQLSKYNEVIEPLFKTIRKNNDESSRLATLRDTLLPKLMNGEIKIAE